MLPHNSSALYLPLQDVYIIGGVGNVLVGQVETGVIKLSALVSFASVNVTTEVKSFEIRHEVVSKALSEENVGFSVNNMSIKDVPYGHVAGGREKDLPVEAAGFMPQMIILNFLHKINTGYPELDGQTAYPAHDFAYIKKIDTDKKLEDDITFLKSSNVAITEMVNFLSLKTSSCPRDISCLESFSGYSLGCFAVHHMKWEGAVCVMKTEDKMADGDVEAIQSSRRAQTYTITNACYFSFLQFGK